MATDDARLTASPADSRRWFLWLFLTALALRMAPALSAAGDRFDVLVTDDPPYHALRVTRLLTDAPSPGDPDPLVAHPLGAVAHWPWGFDWLFAALVGPKVGSAPARHDVALAMSFLIPWLGALAIPLLFSIGGRFTHHAAALIGAGLLCFLPAHHDYSFFGRVDHHVVEPFIPLLALWGPLRARPKTGGISGVLASGFAAGASFAFVPAALPLAASSVVVGGGLLLGHGPALPVGYGLSCLAATLASLAASPHPFEWVFHSPSLLQVTLMATLVAGLFVGSLSVGIGVRSWIARVGWGVSGSLAAGAVALGSFGEFQAALIGGVHYLRGEGFAALSYEAQGSWTDPVRAVTLMTGLAPLALIGVGRWIAGRPDGYPDVAPRRAVGILAILLIGLAVFQRRFLVAASPVLALAMGEALWWLWNLAGHAAPAKRRAGRIALIGVVLAGLAPSLRHLAVLEPISPMDRAMVRAARTLAETPSDPIRPRGVLAPWSHGHVFQFEAGLPTVCDNFYGPPENDRALMRCLETLYETDETRATSRLNDLALGFVVLKPPHPDQVRAEAALIGVDPDSLVARDGAFRPAFARTLWGRLGLFAQRARPGDRGPAGTRFLGRIREVRGDTGTIEAEVLLFTVDPGLTP